MFSRRKRRVCENHHRSKDTLETRQLNVKEKIRTVKAVRDNWGNANADWVWTKKGLHVEPDRLGGGPRGSLTDAEASGNHGGRSGIRSS